MCLITFCYKDHPKYRLILAANRDEFYKRPARGARFWKEENHPEVLAGKDLQGGGTWMGINRDGRWAALTNYRDPSIQKENPPSRGELVLNYLKESKEAKSYLELIDEHSEAYNGFNLLVGNKNGLYHYSNQTKKILKVEEGLHGISNALLDTPWPKTEKAKRDLKDIIQEEEPDRDRLFELLKNEQKASETDMPDTGIPKEWEKAVSSIFIRTENYGTRCSTLLLIGHDGKIEFTEKRYSANTGNVSEINEYSFMIS